MKITIPTDWSEVTVRQFQELSKVPDLDYSDLDKQLKILEILTGVSDDYFLNISFTDLKKIIKKTDFVNHTPLSLRKKHRLKIKGRRYAVNYIPQELIAGEYIDLTELTKEGANVNKNIAKILAIYLKPINIFGFPLRRCYEKKNGKLIQTIKSRKYTEELILDNLTMDVVFPMSGFFLNLWQRLTKATLTYLEEQMEQKMKEVKRVERDLLKSGVGM